MEPFRTIRLFIRLKTKVKIQCKHSHTFNFKFKNKIRYFIKPQQKSNKIHHSATSLIYSSWFRSRFFFFNCLSQCLIAFHSYHSHARLLFSHRFNIDSFGAVLMRHTISRNSKRKKNSNLNSSLDLNYFKMDELKDVSIHHTALKILSEITAMKNYDENIYKTVQVFYWFN